MVMQERGVLELNKVSKSYGERAVLSEVSMSLPHNKIYGIIGKSGCGKTTLLNLLIGFLQPSRGTVYYQGKDLNKVSKEVRMKFGFASQSYSFYPKLSVKENLQYFGKLYGIGKVDIEDRTYQLLNMLRLSGEENTTGDNLSSGMKKRLDIACALIHDPEVLLLDEPTADLDPALRSDVLSAIKKIRAAGKTILITTHLLGEIEILCDRIFLLHHQRLKDMGSPDHFDKGYTKEVKIKLKSRSYASLYSVLQGCPVDIESANVEDRYVTITTKTPEQVMQYVMSFAQKHDDKIEHLSVSRPSLDRLFMELTK